MPLLLISIFLMGCTSIKTTPYKACTEEARLCSDGSSVARTQPNCEFAPCPSDSWFTTGTLPPQACTMEAKLCPDGSAVGRSGPNCEFAACPGEASSNCSCPSWYKQEGEVCNPECYYSTPKCLMPSIQCK